MVSSLLQVQVDNMEKIQRGCRVTECESIHLTIVGDILTPLSEPLVCLNRMSGLPYPTLSANIVCNSRRTNRLTHCCRKLLNRKSGRLMKFININSKKNSKIILKIMFNCFSLYMNKRVFFLLFAYNFRLIVRNFGFIIFQTCQILHFSISYSFDHFLMIAFEKFDTTK